MGADALGRNRKKSTGMPVCRHASREFVACFTAPRTHGSKQMSYFAKDLFVKVFLLHFIWLVGPG